MNLREFQKTSVANFRGLYRRGNTDQVPPDHAIDLVNLDFNKTGETFTRVGLASSLDLGHPVKRMFLATTIPGNYYLITYDGGTSLYIFDMQTQRDYVLYTHAALKGFYAVNEWGKCYILPAGDDFSNDMVMQVIFWSVPDNSMLIRPALGYAPQVPPVGSGIPMMAAVETGTGDIDPGKHKFAVSFITNTGFTTRPGIEDTNHNYVEVSYVASGGAGVVLYNIPLGPYGTVARQILVTKADEDEFFYLASGLINDNTTNVWPTSGVLSWFDTDLAVSADDLFDLREYIGGGTLTSSGIFKYRGRTLVWGFRDNEHAHLDYVAVSKVADPESFDLTNGFVQLPSETDGNYVSGACNLRDVLYFTKTVGIYSTQDNFDNPNTWLVVPVDGGVGCTFYAMSTLSSAQTALSLNEFLLFADIGGIYVFNGTVQQPPITWKIDDIWKRVTKGAMHKITMVANPFDQIIYCLVPLDGATEATCLLVGTCTDGIDYQNIKWSTYVFPYCAKAIGLFNFQDKNDFQYLLRIGRDANGIDRLDPYATDDSGIAITAYWQSALQGYDLGKLSIFRALVIRAEGTTAAATTTTLNVSLGAQDGQRVHVANSFNVPLQPGMEYTRQINYTSEKMAIKVLSNSKFRLDRLDVYGKVQFDSRPLGA